MKKGEGLVWNGIESGRPSGNAGRALPVVAALAVLAGWLCLAVPPLEAQGTPTSNDPNFILSATPLTSGLSAPGGLAFRQPNTLTLAQFGANQVTVVNATSGAATAFVTPPTASADQVAIRSSDGLVAVGTLAPDVDGGPIYFYDSNGVLQGSIPRSTPTRTGCFGGMAFDAAGNFFVAAGPEGLGGVGGCSETNWNVYEFAGPSPWNSTGFALIDGSLSGPINGLVFAAAPPPSGSFYAVASNGDVYEITPCTDCGEFPTFFSSTIAQVSTTTDQAGNPHPGIAGVAVDPLTGDLYISEFGGSNILRIPAGGIPVESEQTPFTFASGFTNSFGIVFDTNGNLYVNETNAGNLWKFTRKAFATGQLPLVAGKVNTFTFTNPNPAMSDQIHTIMIPASANLNGAAFIQAIFVPTDPNALNSTLQNGTTGDTTFFGGAPVPPGTTCVLAPSAGSNCLVVVQKCYDANHNPFDICPIREPSTSPDLIQLTITFTGAPANSAFLIGFDNGDGQDITDVTSADPSAGTKSLCSKTFLANLGTSTAPDFSLTASPDPVNIVASGSDSSTVTVTSINGFSSVVTLSVADVPLGFTASLSPTSVTPPANGTATSVLNVGISQNATVSGIMTIVGNLLASGCIDNAGIANALTAKLSAAQSAINSGQIQTAVNVLTAFKDQVQAQSGKHIVASCTTAFPLIVVGKDSAGEGRFTSVSVTFSPAGVLRSVVGGLITSLKASAATADPITGFVVNTSGVGVQNVTVGLFDSTSHQIATAVGPDATGFYYFATTGTLTVGASYTIQAAFPVGSPLTSATPPSVPFTWGGKALAFTFTVQ